ncbi:MAG: termination factor Rho [Pseudomonadota bacterium]
MRGDKDKYSGNQKRKAAHIEESYKSKGVPEQEAEKRAWATVNKQSGGGEKAGGSGEKKSPEAKKTARKNSAKRTVVTKHGLPRAESEKLETKASLLKKAREKNIAGRSTMSKTELIEALHES